MESGNDKKKEHREITYQVGWKKGKIEWHDEASETILSKQLQDHETEKVKGIKKLDIFWLPAMGLPDMVVLPLLYSLPIFCFVLTLILVYGLRHG
ncbi:hypothetical protein [Paenibacillus sp. N3.4]|uniref:hypothetical protein n=1 Tax=Paenibacillus sp. N3.4 TaxID=2603222 RepID=UPI0011CA3B2E|nr:hypothetical protein [Paenibacillus sp. N3.4]TXK85982.1 hypothetical protein FU659_00555 [Paenibacillus sp. N3.4]